MQSGLYQFLLSEKSNRDCLKGAVSTIALISLPWKKRFEFPDWVKWEREAIRGADLRRNGNTPGVSLQQLPTDQPFRLDRHRRYP
jgi:hypothetical protein